MATTIGDKLRDLLKQATNTESNKPMTRKEIADTKKAKGAAKKTVKKSAKKTAKKTTKTAKRGR